jgi:hypothetical protein
MGAASPNMGPYDAIFSERFLDVPLAYTGEHVIIGA